MPNKKHAASVLSLMRLDNRNSGMNFFNEINADKGKCNFLWCCKPVSMRL